MRIQIKGLKEAKSALRQVRGEVRTELTRAVSAVAKSGLDRIQVLTPKNTGVTAEEWFIREGYENDAELGRAYVATIDHPYNKPGAKQQVASRVSGRRVLARIANDGTFNLLEALEYGTKAHEIRPRKVGGFLVFEMGGKVIFARSVHHPGTRGYGMVRKTATAIQHDLPRTAEEMIEQAIRKVA